MEYRDTPPIRFLGIGLVVLILMVGLVTWINLARPWLGVRFEPTSAGAVEIAAIARQSPLAREALGATVVQIAAGGATGGAADGASVPLIATDLTDEPDKLITYEAYNDFLARQGRLAEVLAAPEVTLVLADGRALTVQPLPKRPLADLPLGYWIQIGAGTIGILVAGWVLALRPNDLAARYLMLTAVALALAAFTAATYSSRELAWPAAAFYRLSSLNSLGTLSFGGGMIGVFSYYRSALLPHWVMPPILLVICLLTLAHVTQVMPNISIGLHAMIVGLLVAILVAIGEQYRRSRGDPVARAGVRWIGQSFLIGVGGCVAIISTPPLLGVESIFDQSLAFGFLIVLFVGIAIGVARHRLFDLEGWSFSLLFYLSAAFVFLGLDALFLYVLTLDRVPALALALFAVAFLYLPVRDWLWRRLMTPAETENDALMFRLAAVAFATGPKERQSEWGTLWRDWFQPMRVEVLEAPIPVTPKVAAGGGELLVPGLGDLPGLRLIWKRKGRRLFSPRDAETVERLIRLLTGLSETRDSYQRGVLEERSRISRDMHDNIGIQLLGALHSGEPARKDGMIREALAELRVIVSGDLPGQTGEMGQAGDVLGELRHELGEVLAAAGVVLDWRSTPEADRCSLPSAQALALRAVMREAVSNVLAHAGATRVDVRTTTRDGGIHLSFEDDGKGPAIGAVAAPNRGNGLKNMRSRMESLGGKFLESHRESPQSPAGMRLEFSLPSAASGGAA